MPLPVATAGSGLASWTLFDWQPWLLVGFTGNAVFMSRFLVQWVASERKRQSVIPVAFWWLSIAGSVIMSIYFIGKNDLPGIIGFLPNSVVYIRNLQLIRSHKAKQESLPRPVESPPVPSPSAGGKDSS